MFLIKMISINLFVDVVPRLDGGHHSKWITVILQQHVNTCKPFRRSVEINEAFS